MTMAPQPPPTHATDQPLVTVANQRSALTRVILKHRRPLIMVVHLGLIAATNYVAFWLRFDGLIPRTEARLALYLLPALLAIRATTFLPFRLYEGLWRYTSISDLRNIINGVGLSSVAFYLLVRPILGVGAYPRSVFIIDAILLICAMSVIRLTHRIYRELASAKGGRRVLIIGAGSAGELIVRDMKNNSASSYQPIGFVDDDRAKVKMRIHGVPVLGTREDLPRIMREHHPQEVLIAISSAAPGAIRDLVRVLQSFKVRITTVPKLEEILDGRVAVSGIRTLAVEDLLARPPVGLDSRRISRLIQDRRVMITGAGGSIGSELARQILALRPASLVLFERYENSLYEIDAELSGHAPGRVHAVIGDVTDAARVEAVLTHYRPEIVFHAAAHKHVPMMEHNPCEAVKNNVRGARVLVQAVEQFGVDRFILISTDKAVNPSSVMGATKRVAELLTQARGATSRTSLLTVRFGNVLGSNGSVLPRFMEQIKAGGPVTVTHRDMQRFFMLIPEAVQLVLHAAAFTEPGAVYALEMGEQIKVLDMARDVIRLCGFVPDEEIPITFVGLRPGEKLFEELVGQNETIVPSGIQSIRKVRPLLVPDPPVLYRQIDELERLAMSGDVDRVIAQLRVIVPEFESTVKQAAAVAVPAAAEADVEPVEAAGAVGTTAHACPECGVREVYRSHAKTLREVLQKALSDDRAFRCHHCGWRGWLPMLERAHGAPPPLGSPPADDLSALDALTESKGPPIVIPLPDQFQSSKN